MTLGYKIAYRLGLTPWEKAGRTFAAQLPSMLAELEADGPPYGKALDIGCGTGDHVIELALRGWTVTGIDVVPMAIRKARAKVSAASVDATIVEGDVTNLPAAVGDGYRLLLDIGCFHGLDAEARSAYASGATAISLPGARLVLFAFGPGKRGPLPRGVSRGEIEQTFTGWTLTRDEPADTSGMPGPLKKSNPRWFHLTLA